MEFLMEYRGRFWTDHYEEITAARQPNSNVGTVLTQQAVPPLHICYFDLEVRRGPEEFGGDWSRVRQEGGVSMLVIWDSSTNRPHFYDDYTLDSGGSHLSQADVVVSFNGLWFDIPLVENHLGKILPTKEHFDLFDAAKRSLEAAGKPWKGNGLDAICSRTLGRGKNGASELAPKLAQEGRWAELTEYCLNDVLLTRDLCDFVREKGYIIDRDGDQLPIDVPKWLKKDA